MSAITIGAALIREFEGLHRLRPDGLVEAYPDPIHGWERPTIGYGMTCYPVAAITPLHDARQVARGDTITAEFAEACLLAWIGQRLTPALEQIPTWPLMNDNQRGALYSFAYNLGAKFYGEPKFRSITMVCDSPEKWHHDTWVRRQFVKYRNPGTPAEKGLRRRRLAEAKVFCE